jgi:carnitine-CoA ligase
MTITFDSANTPLRELASASNTDGGIPFLTVEGRTATYAEAWIAVRHFALGLREAGVVAGDRVVILLPNCLEAVWAWFGVQALGAIDAPVSIEAPGPFLHYLIDDLQPAAVVGTPELLQSLAGLERPPRLAIVVQGGPDDHPVGSRTEHLSFDAVLSTGASARDDLSLPTARTPGTILYSSGTTGPSKGVVLAQGYYSSLAQAHIEVAEFRRGDRFYCVQPLCHIDGRSSVIDPLHLRGHAILGTRFSARRFWDEVEEVDADVFVYIGTMLHLIHKQPERPLRDPERRRTAMGSATPPSIHRDFERRFNVDLIEGYGMTELGLILAHRRSRTEVGSIGRALPWIDVQVVDEDDDPVADGVTGQLLARPRGPHLHMEGYWNRPEATVEAWRGLWFHTGDLVVRHSDGAFEYVGRTKDMIRRRGENVSAWEVEQAATQHQGVLEAAAIGLPSDLGDEDVALLVVVKPETQVDLSELRRFIAGRIPRFAVPRYIEIVEGLPKTPSERVDKGLVRQRGLSGAARDFDVAGANP